MNMDLIFGNFLPETLTYNTTADENRRKEDIFISVSVQFLPIISNNIQISSIKLRWTYCCTVTEQNEILSERSSLRFLFP